MRRCWIVAALTLCGCDGSRRLERLPLPDAPEVRQAPATASEAPAPAEPRIGALDVEIYIRQAARPSSPEIGVLHFGTTLVRSREPVGTHGCADGWYRVEPEGYVCHGKTTTLEPGEHPLLLAARERGGRFSTPTPYRWFESRGDAPVYRRLPTSVEQRRSEPDLDSHGPIPEFLAGHAPSPWAQVHTPRDLRPRLRVVPARSTIAVTDLFDAEGRTFLLTSELLVVPKDRVVELEPSAFSGVKLDQRSRLPLVFVRGEDKPKYRVVSETVVPASHAAAQGRLEPSGERFARLAALSLTGRQRRQRGVRFLETRSGDWIREPDATLVEAQPPRGFELEPGEKWIDVSIFKGTLVAYEGSRAVFATLISPGAHGYKRVDGAPAQFTTPTGTFRLEWKHLSTSMTPDPERASYSLAEVPFTQFFHMPFALHAAYWHDRFGEPKSGGCINLSPRDAKWLFEWTTPTLPAGWHGVRSGGSRGPGTWVRIR